MSPQRVGQQTAVVLMALSREASGRQSALAPWASIISLEFIR